MAKRGDRKRVSEEDIKRARLIVDEIEGEYPSFETVTTLYFKETIKGDSPLSNVFYKYVEELSCEVQREQVAKILALIAKNYGLEHELVLEEIATYLYFIQSELIARKPMEVYLQAIYSHRGSDGAKKIKRELLALSKALRGLSFLTLLELGGSNRDLNLGYIEDLAKAVDETLEQLKKRRCRNINKTDGKLIVVNWLDQLYNLYIYRDGRYTFSSSESGDFYNFVYEIMIILEIDTANLSNVLKFYFRNM